MENNDLEHKKNIISDDIKEIIDLLNDVVEFATGAPVIGVIAKLIKLTSNIRDRLFVEKVITFINETKELGETERKKTLCDIEEKMKSRAGEQLLYLIERMNNKQKVKYLSKLFIARAKGIIDTACFFRLSLLLERLPYMDIEKLSMYKSDYYDEATIDIFSSTGAICLSKIRNGTKELNSDKYILTFLGRKLLEILFGEKCEMNEVHNNSIIISGSLKFEVVDTIEEVNI